MSMPGQTLFCSKCEYKKTFFYGGSKYVYRLKDDKEVDAPIGLGWCFKCNSATRLQLGLSVDYLTNQQEDLSRKLNRIKQSYPNSGDLPASLRDEVQEMINDLERCEQLLQVLNGIDSINNCLDCGSVEVIPFDTHNASIYHFNCGGQLKFRMSEIWVRFAKKTKTLIPKTE